jgi:hypothetical protein
MNKDDLSACKFNPPESSEWKCYMFGNPIGGGGFVYRPAKDAVPNRFVRWMMQACFACTWVKVKGVGEIK